MAPTLVGTCEDELIGKTISIFTGTYCACMDIIVISLLLLLFLCH